MGLYTASMKRVREIAKRMEGSVTPLRGFTMKDGHLFAWELIKRDGRWYRHEYGATIQSHWINEVLQPPTGTSQPE